MSELLLELFSEEIPARMQARAAEDLKRLVGEGLEAAGLTSDGARAFATPRRLTLVVDGLPDGSPEVREERKGPRVGAPEKALEGFLRAAGLGSVDEAEIRTDEKKGDFYVAVVEKPGRPTAEIVAEVVPDAIRRFPWPKSQRWGDGKLRWVRPLHGVLCLLDGTTVAFEVDGIASGAETSGHRFMGAKPFGVKDFEDYASKLRQAKVILDGPERAEIILGEAREIAQAEGLALVEDSGLLAENAGLVEWPVALMGTFDEGFLDVPPEVLTTSMKAHQKCFSVTDPKTGKLVNRFVLISNLMADDGGDAIVAGNERVIRARLSDAKFFWDQDRKHPLETLLPQLEGIIFHEKLGTQAERVARIKALARELAPVVGADPEQAERAAALAKADLVTDMVGEFPEMQGLMGRYYALDQGADPAVAQAIEEHYRPQGPADAIPTEPVSIAVALADKLDTLAGFWAIDEKPTGSKDPYALRRAALGVIRILLENNIRLGLFTATASPFARVYAAIERHHIEGKLAALDQLHELGFERHQLDVFLNAEIAEMELTEEELDRLAEFSASKALDMLAFFADRLKVYLRDQGARHDLIDAVFSVGGQDDLLLIVKRVEALGRFLDSDDGANLLVGAKRAQNILRIEEKKDGTSYDGAADPGLFAQDEEKALADAVDRATDKAEATVAAQDFEGAMSAMAGLRQPVDAFFDHVTVNADDAALRENRLKLLSRIRAATLKVADFSKIEG